MAAAAPEAQGRAALFGAQTDARVRSGESKSLPLRPHVGNRESAPSTDLGVTNKF